MDLLLMFIMMWRELKRPHPTPLFPDGVGRGTYVEFLQMCPSPARHLVERLFSRILYVCQDFQMSSNASIFSAHEQILSTEHVSQIWHLWKRSLHMACTLTVNLMQLGLLCMCPPVGFHKHNKLSVSQTSWVYCVCSDHLCNTCTTPLVML